MCYAAISISFLIQYNFFMSKKCLKTVFGLNRSIILNSSSTNCKKFTEKKQKFNLSLLKICTSYMVYYTDQTKHQNTIKGFVFYSRLLQSTSFFKTFIFDNQMLNSSKKMRLSEQKTISFFFLFIVGKMPPNNSKFSQLS